MIQFRNYSVAYGENTVLKDFNFDIELGKSYALVGPSGCGKTTLAYSISGLLPETAVCSGACDQIHGQLISTVFQEYGLFPWKTVYDNATLPLVLKNESEKGQVDGLLSQLGIAGLADRYPHELSGGQKQRVAIARALISDPDLIVMDEPFSSVDTITREQLQEDLKILIKKREKTLFLVTHNIEEAVFLAHQILVLDASGKLVEVFDNPCFSLENGREEALFYELCIEIRKCMKGGGA